MKLNKNQIEFIDIYLQKSDVIFVDLRAEMTDHIASTIEAQMKDEDIDFYTSFKSFMITNKQELLYSNNKMFSHFWNATVQFSKTLYKPYNLIFGLFLLFGHSYFKAFKNDSILKIIHLGLFFTIIGFAIFQTSFFIIKKKRYLYLEKTANVLSIIYFFNLFFNGFYKDFHGNYVTVGITLFLFFAFMIYYVSTIRKFQFKYM